MRSKLLSADIAILNEIDKLPLEDIHLFNSRLGSVLSYNDKERKYYLTSKYDVGIYNQFGPSMIKNIPYFISCTYIHEIYFFPNEATEKDIEEIVNYCSKHYTDTFIKDPILNAYFEADLESRASSYQKNEGEIGIHLNYFHNYRS